MVPIDEELSIAATGVTYPIKGKGIILMKIGKITIELKDVLFAPDLRKNFISGPKLDYNGHKFIGERHKVRVSFKNKFLFCATLKNGIYYIYPKYPSRDLSEYKFEACSEQMETLHLKMAHVSSEIIVNTQT